MFDDPLSLVLWSSWLMAAGMYPVGFLFGTCSACCDQCPEQCSKCTHYASNGFSCSGLYDSVTALTYAIDGYGSATINNPSSEPSSGCGDNSIAIPVEDLPAGENEYLSVNDTPCVSASSLSSVASVDACGCDVCVIEVVLHAQVQMENDGNLVIGKAFSAAVDACNETTITLAGAGGFEVLTEDNVPDAAAVVAWFDALDITVSVTLPGCDCGACCDNGCEENVAEGGCATWQGVGVDCDPDPCV